MFVGGDIVWFPRWRSKNHYRISLKGVYNTLLSPTKGSLRSLPRPLTYCSFFSWVSYIVKIWSSHYHHKGKSGLYGSNNTETVVKSGGLCIVMGGEICVEGIIPMPTSPLTL